MSTEWVHIVQRMCKDCVKNVYRFYKECGQIV